MSESNRIYSPPGGILIWIILTIELITFIPALIIFLVHRLENPREFMNSAAQLDLTLGTINTTVLIVGGMLAAEGLRMLREEKSSRAGALLWLAAGTGTLFLVLKTLEYHAKLNQGLSLHYNDFFLLYWMITGFHFLHVLVATGLLVLAAQGVQKKRYDSGQHDDVETIAVFWHMCDLIWILVFPTIYILARYPL